MGQMRVVIASMTIEEINSDREKLIKGITEGVDVELHKVGLHLINANITDIQDASGYINALGKEAAARAIMDATINVAEETRRGEIGKAEAEKDQTVPGGERPRRRHRRAERGPDQDCGIRRQAASEAGGSPKNWRKWPRRCRKPRPWKKPTRLKRKRN